MTEYWTPEQQGKIAEAAAWLRQDGTIASMYMAGVGYVYPDGSAGMPGDVPLHITVTVDEHIDLLSNTGHKERVAAGKAAGKAPFVKL